MTTFAIQFKIATLKRKAQKHLRLHRSIAADYSCGLAIAQHISPALAGHANEFNTAMAELEELDPNCPKGNRL